MVIRKKTIALLILVTFVPTVGFLCNSLWQRNQQLDSFATECPAAASASDWRRLQRVSLEWLSIAPSDSRARFWQGEALQQLGKYDEAIQHFERIQIDEPRGIDATIRRMNIQFFIRHQPSEALKTASTLLEKDPSLSDPLRLRIYFFAMTFQRDKLLREIDIAIRCRADLPEHFVYLMLLEDLSFSDGTSVVEKWLRHDDKLQEVLSDSLFAHQVLSEREKALTGTERLNGADFNTLRNRCRQKAAERKESSIILELAIRLELDGGDPERAEALLEQVPDTATQDPVFWLHRGKYAADQQNASEAKASFEKAIQLHPLAWRTRSHLANVYRLEGDIGKAMAMQELAANGASVAGECLRLKSSRDVSNQILRRVAEFAGECGAREVVHAIDRRRI